MQHKIGVLQKHSRLIFFLSYFEFFTLKVVHSGEQMGPDLVRFLFQYLNVLKGESLKKIMRLTKMV